MTYEMLVGDPPHVASTAQAIVAKLLTERPPSVQVARPTVGDQITYAIERDLETLPADRWSGAAEFAEALSGRMSTGGDARTPGPRALVAPQRLVRRAGCAGCSAVYRSPRIFLLFAKKFKQILCVPSHVEPSDPKRQTVSLSELARCLVEHSRRSVQQYQLRRRVA